MWPWRARLVGTGLLLAALATPTFGGDYADPAGFSFTYPEGWFAATQLNLKELPPAVREVLTKNRADLGRVSVMVIRPTSGEFAENVNVVVERQQIPIEQASVDKLREILPQQLRTMGVEVENFQGELRQLGANRAIVMEYRASMPGIPFPIKQRQVYFAGGGKTFIVTCSASLQTFAEHSATFDSILSSFRAPAPISQGFDFSRVIMMGVIGGVVGGLAAIIMKVVGKKKVNPR